MRSLEEHTRLVFLLTCVSEVRKVEEDLVHLRVVLVLRAVGDLEVLSRLPSARLFTFS